MSGVTIQQTNLGAGDIQIGAVELKDATTDTRAKIKNDGVDNALVTTSNYQDVLSKYRISDTDDDASPNYYGFLDKDGAWYILKETIVSGANTYRYAKGTSNYATNWTNRASLSYDYFDVVF